MTEFFIYAGYGVSSGFLVWVTTWGIMQAMNLLREIGK